MLCSFPLYNVTQLYTHTHTYTHTCICVCALSHSVMSDSCDPMDCSLQESSVHGILQARLQEWVAMPSSRGSSRPRDQTRVSQVSCIGRWVLYHLHHLGSLHSIHTHTHTHTHIYSFLYIFSSNILLHYSSS